MKVVVTGGAGFIGSNLTDALVERGFDVHVIDDLSGGKREHVHKGALFHEVDVRGYDALEKILEDANYVFHLAALPRVPFSIDEPVLTNEVNVGGTVNVLRAAEKNGVRRVIYSASSSAYGDQSTLPLREDMAPDPKSPYGLQKLVGEQYMKLWSTVYGLPTASLRYFNIYGPRLDPEGAYALVIGKFLKQKKEGRPLTITGDGEQTRDFTYVRDAVRANLLAMESEYIGKGEVINVGSGNDVSVNRIAELIGGGVEYVPPRLEPRHTRADISRARELLGWRPEIGIEEGIEELKKIYNLKS